MQKCSILGELRWITPPWAQHGLSFLLALKNVGFNSSQVESWRAKITRLFVTNSQCDRYAQPKNSHFEAVTLKILKSDQYLVLTLKISWKGVYIIWAAWICAQKKRSKILFQNNAFHELKLKGKVAHQNAEKLCKKHMTFHCYPRGVGAPPLKNERVKLVKLNFWIARFPGVRPPPLADNSAFHPEMICTIV